MWIRWAEGSVFVLCDSNDWSGVHCLKGGAETFNTLKKYLDENLKHHNVWSMD